MHKKRAVGESVGRVRPTHAEDPIEIFTDTSLSLCKEKVEVIRLQPPVNVIRDRVIHQNSRDLSRAVGLGFCRRIDDLVSCALGGIESVTDTVVASVSLYDEVVRSSVINHIETLLIRPDVELGNVGQVIHVRQVDIEVWGCPLELLHHCQELCLHVSRKTLEEVLQAICLPIGWLRDLREA